MVGVIGPSRLRNQPANRLTIDWRNELSAGLHALLLPGQELVNRWPVLVSGIGAITGTQYGPALRGNGSTIHKVVLPQTLGQEITMMTAGRILRSAGAGLIAGLGSSAGTAMFGPQFSTSGGAFGRMILRQTNGGSASLADFRDAQSSTQFEYVVCGGTASGGALSSYWGGTRDNSASGSTGVNTTFNRLSIAGLSRSTEDYAASGNDILFSAVWDRVLSADEILEFSINPWQIIRPAKRSLYFDVTATDPVIPTLSNTVATSITSTTVIPQVTVTF